MKLYDLELSGNCYKVRLFLALIEKDYELVPVDFLAGEHKKAPLNELNPFEEIPILTDDDITLRDSQAILVYLARKYGGEAWLPIEAGSMAQVMEWLSTAANEVARGPNDARLHDKFGYDLDHDVASSKSTRILDLLERHLKRCDWLALNRPTIADIACFPYVALGHEGRVPVGDRPNVQAWINRIKALPGFISMPEL
ncbi:MAG: glutathione S-transferase [Pseudomonadota bacterium]